MLLHVLGNFADEEAWHPLRYLHLALSVVGCPRTFVVGLTLAILCRGEMGV